MTNSPIRERTFTDREVREVLKRAVEGESTKVLLNGRDLTLAELRSIAIEAGIDSSQFEAAVRTVTQREELLSNAIAGVPTFVRFKQTVDGELDRAYAAEVVSVIRRVMGQHGDVTDVSGSREWRTKGGSVERLISVVPGSGGTVIEASANLRQAAIGTLLSGGVCATMIGLIGITAAVGGPTLNIAALAATGVLGVLSYVGLKTIVKRVLNRESGKLERVIDELSHLIREAQDGRTDSNAGA